MWKKHYIVALESIFLVAIIETIIRDNQHQYFDILVACDNVESSILLVEVLLHSIFKTCGG